MSYREHTYKALTVEVADHVAEVTLVGPGKGNAMGPDFWAEVPVVFDALDADPDVRAVVLTGSGRQFTYGLDLTSSGLALGPLFVDGGLARPRTDFHDHIRAMQRAAESIGGCRKPVVAAVHGWCIGGGIDIIAAADVRYASADARFSIREVKIAIVADMGTLAYLPSIIGQGHLRELLFTGRDVDAAHARRIGLVNDVADDHEGVLALARGTAAEIAANPPLAVQGAKAVLENARADEIAAANRYVAAWNAAFLASKDLGEAMGAVMEKRTARFAGE